jgi:hypothetical protein
LKEGFIPSSYPISLAAAARLKLVLAGFAESRYIRVGFPSASQNQSPLPMGGQLFCCAQARSVTEVDVASSCGLTCLI